MRFEKRNVLGWTRKTALLGGVFLGACGAISALPAVALAQTTPDSSATASQTTASSGVTVGEIMVTATKRDERLQDVPEAVAVVTGQEIASTGPINNTQDVLNMVPASRFTNLADPLNSELSIRGSGTERATGAESSVGLYFDGVYVGVGANQLGGRNLAPIDSFDLNNLEVYEGPQGALYGRDSEYGVLNLIPAQPAFNDSATADDTFNFETEANQLTAIINYKINDNWAVRFGAEELTQSKGFEFNPDENTYYDQTKGYMVRAQIRYQNGHLDMDLLAEHQDLQVPSFWSSDQIYPKNTATGFPGTAAEPLGFFQDPRTIPHNGLDYSWEGVDQVLLSIKYDAPWATISSTTSWRTLDTIAEFDSDYTDLPTEIGLQTQCKANSVAPNACGAYPFSETNNTGNATTWYEDLHLAGTPVLDGHLTWLAGLELLNQPNHGLATATQNPCPQTSSIKLPSGQIILLPAGNKVGNGVCVGAPGGVIEQISLLAGSVFPAVTQPDGEYSTYSGNYFSWSPYASLSYALPDGFKVEGDLRYSNDHKDTITPAPTQLYSTVPYNFITNGQPIGTSTYNFNKPVVTYSFTLSWKIPFSPWSDMLYFRTGSGYRVGGFNLAKTPPLVTNCTSATNETGCPAGVSPPLYYSPVTPSYTDEYTVSYEGGFKGNITSHVYFVLDGYYETTTDALAAVGDGCGTRLIATDALSACITGNTNYTVNAGTTRGWGIETQLDSSWDLAGGKLALNMTGSREYSWYASQPAGVVGLPIVGTSVAENPAWTASVLFNYSHPITDKLSAFFNMVYHGQWGGIQDPVTTAGVFAPLASYGLVDLKTGVTYDRLQVALIVTNLTNDVYDIAEFGQAGVNTITGQPVFVQSQERLSLPRSVSVEAKYTW